MSRWSGATYSTEEVAASAGFGVFNRLQSCVVAMEAGGGAHYCHRVIGELGHELRLMPRAYVKPFVKRQMNNAACTEAISEVAMRFVPVK